MNILHMNRISLIITTVAAIALNTASICFFVTVFETSMLVAMLITGIIWYGFINVVVKLEES